MKKVWAIIDDKIGNAKQAIAVAKALGFNFEIKRIKYNFLGCLPNWCKFSSFFGVDLKNSDNLAAPYPELIISSGRRTAKISAYLKKQNPQIKTIHIMNPEMDLADFDLVCLPLHDTKLQYANLRNIFYTVGAPCLLESNITNFEPLAKFSPPFVTLFIGGKTKTGDYKPKDYQILIKKAADLTKEIKGTLLISNSRRTSQNLKQIIDDNVDCKYYFYDWQNAKGEDNPYQYFLNISEFFIVTADSISICSEVLTLGKPLYFYQLEQILPKKHKKFLNYIENTGLSKNLMQAESLKNYNYQPLSDTKKIADFVKSNWL